MEYKKTTNNNFIVRAPRLTISFCLSLTVIMASFANPASAREYTVEMLSATSTTKYRFEPKVLKIEPGDTVVWVNAQNEPHDVMAEAAPEGAENWKSPYLTKKGQSWSYTFTVSGTYDYHCHPHEGLGMVGKIIVGDASTAAQSVPVEGHHHATEPDATPNHDQHH